MRNVLTSARKCESTSAERKRRRSMGSAWRAATCGGNTERRLLGAYLALYVVPADEDGARTVQLARFGSYGVRLIELPHDMAADVPPLWMELYANDGLSTLDSCGRDDFEEAVTAADELIAQARALHHRSPTGSDVGEVPLIG